MQLTPRAQALLTNAFGATIGNALITTIQNGSPTMADMLNAFATNSASTIVTAIGTPPTPVVVTRTVLNNNGGETIQFAQSSIPANLATATQEPAIVTLAHELGHALLPGAGLVNTRIPANPSQAGQIGVPNEATAQVLEFEVNKELNSTFSTTGTMVAGLPIQTVIASATSSDSFPLNSLSFSENNEFRGIHEI